MRDAKTTEALERFVARRHAVDGDVAIELRELGGGLEARGVARVYARFRDPRGRRQTVSLVLKQLEGHATREARVYERVVPHAPSGIAPAVLGTEWTGPRSCRLYLEAVTPSQRWPWKDVGEVGRVLGALARMHAEPPAAPAPPWDYDAELVRSGAQLVDALDRLPRDGDLARVRRARRAVERLVEKLPALRRQLVDDGATLIHGDVHPGNALVRRRRAAEHPVLLDWGRARRGSAFEDVASWLHSLGLWEPEARRKHDTLLSRYLVARGEKGAHRSKHARRPLARGRIERARRRVRVPRHGRRAFERRHAGDRRPRSRGLRAHPPACRRLHAMTRLISPGRGSRDASGRRAPRAASRSGSTRAR